MKPGTSIAAYAAWAALLVAVTAYAGDVVGAKSTGKWQAGTFAQVNVACLQAWVCTPGGAIMHSAETIVVATPNEGVMGICNAGNGPADSCNVCASSPPKTPCEYWLEKK